MKYAFMSFSTPRLTLAEMLALAKRLGYAGIEPRIGQNHRHGIEIETDAAARQQIRRQAADSGIALCCIATSCKYADPATAPAMVEQTRQAIELAADVGAPRLRVFGGQIPTGLVREGAIQQVSYALRAVADHAQRRGVTLCLETHDDWTDPSHVAEVMRRFSHPAIAVNWDIMHPVRQSGWSIAQSYETLKPWIRHVHIHDGVTVAGKLELRPIGTGEIDHRAAVRLLMADGYDGYLSGEWINWADAYDVHLPRELATMRGYEQGQ